MKLIVGLGNPTAEYVGTRHNIGFAAVSELAEKYRIEIREKKHKALCGKGEIAGERVLLLKPQTYMNLSGESVRAALDFYKGTPQDILVLYDDISLPVGQLRVRAKGSAGGHNGIRNIIAHLGTEEFARVRIGIGEKTEGGDLKDYVLGKIPPKEQEAISAALSDAVGACELFVSGELERAMNRYNQKKKQGNYEGVHGTVTGIK